MRHLALLLTLLLATFGLAATAKALPLPAGQSPLGAVQPLSALVVSEEDEAGAAEEPEAEEGDEGEACDPEVCEEEGEEAGECVIESAGAAVSVNAHSRRVRLTIDYTASAPATFTLDYSLRGAKGGLHLGDATARFHHSGVFHDSVAVGKKRLDKLLAAREFFVELQAVGAPSYCRERLTAAAPRRASHRHRAGAPGRPGARARTRGR